MIRPGCFGVPSVFSFTSRVCGKCEHHGNCQSQAHAALLGAPPRLVGKLLEQHNEYRRAVDASTPESTTLNTTRPTPKTASKLAVRLPLSDAQLATLSGMTKRAAEYLKRLMVRGIDKEVLTAAEMGRNGFMSSKHRSLHLALERLLEGGLTKASLRLAYCEDLGWSETSAFSEVTLVWKIFQAMGLAVEQGCSLVAAPTVICKNAAIRD